MQTFLHYKLERELGRGASACVYLARENDDTPSVCVKLFHPRLFQDSEFSRRVRREMRLMSDMSHANIVRVQKVYEDTDPPAIILDFIDGDNLEVFQARLPYVLPEIALLIIIEVLKALEYSHARGIVHRDLKPENVLVRKDGQVFVTDFGLAKLENGTTITQTNAIVGSLDFMSPEQATGDRIGPESDLFSVASILYFLTTGTRPFSRATPSATLQAIRTLAPEAPQRRNPKISAGLSALIQKALEKDVSNRFASAKQFRVAAETYLAGLGLVPDLFNLQNWTASPTTFVLEMLRVSSETLISSCEERFKSGKRAEVLELLQHLSLKAPESPAIERLTGELHKQRRSKAVWYFAALVPLLFMLGGAWFWLGSRSVQTPTEPASSTARNAPSAPAVADAPAVVAPAEKTQSEERIAKTPPAPRALKGGEVRFLVPDGVSVLWDGKKVNPNVPLKNQSFGMHNLEMSMPGFAPIRSKVEVRPGKPTVVNAK